MCKVKIHDNNFLQIVVKQQRDILEAAENGDLELIKDLLSQDPNLINAIDKDKYTALHRACYNNHLEVVKYLVKSGASISAKTELQWEPLHSCCQWNHVECAAFLIQCGADVNAPSEGGKCVFSINIVTCTKFVESSILKVINFAQK